MPGKNRPGAVKFGQKDLVNSIITLLKNPYLPPIFYFLRVKALKRRAISITPGILITEKWSPLISFELMGFAQYFCHVSIFFLSD